MKIDESCINHNALNLINDLVFDSYSMIDCDKEAEREFSLMMLGEIKGIISLAEELKKALRA